MSSRRNSNGEGSTYLRKDGRWCASYYYTAQDGTRKRRSIYGKKKSEVQRELRLELTKIDKGQSIIQNRQTLREFYDYWHENIAPNILKDTTIEIYALFFKKFILPKIGDLRLTAISTKCVQDMIIDMQQNDGANARQCKRTRDALSSVLRCAQKQGLIDYVPTSGVEVPKYKPKEKKIWTDSELEQFLDFARSNHPRFYPLYLLLATYGLRSGEVLGIKCKDVELRDGKTDDWGILHIRRQIVRVNGKSCVSTPKTESSARDLPITKEIYDILMPLLQERDGEEWLFSTKNGTHFGYTDFRRRFSTTIEQAGLEHITPHALRHMTCTRICDRERNYVTAQKILGHSSPTTTMNVYQHTDENKMRLALSRSCKNLITLNAAQ